VCCIVCYNKQACLTILVQWMQCQKGCITYLKTNGITPMKKHNMKKWGDLQLALQLIVWVVINICNHLQFNVFLGAWCYWTNCMNSNGCNSPHVKPYTYATCATQLQLCKNNYCVTLMQLICKYHVNIMVTSFLIYQSKFDTWHYVEFWVKIIFFWNIDRHHPLRLLIFMVLNCDIWHN
jgi:hypothetical protein